MLDLLLGTAAGLRVERAIGLDDADLHVPDSCGLEVAAALRRMVARSVVTAERAHEAIDDFVAMEPKSHPSRPFLERAFRLRHNFTPYDAVYVLLADVLGAPLVTTDAPLARATRLHTAIPVLPEAAHRRP